MSSNLCLLNVSVSILTNKMQTLSVSAHMKDGTPATLVINQDTAAESEKVGDRVTPNGAVVESPSQELGTSLQNQEIPSTHPSVEPSEATEGSKAGEGVGMTWLRRECGHPGIGELLARSLSPLQAVSMSRTLKA